jgi:hypothetical protein
MKRPSILATSILTAAALLLPACSDLPPGQPGPFADGAVAGGQLARAATVTSAESLATGSTAGSVASAAIVILAKHKITPHQREVAVGRARVVVARMKAKQARAASKSTGRKEAAAQAEPQGREPEIEARKMKSSQSEPRARKIPRYIAVDTTKDERTVPQAAKSVVIFDTETQEVVGNNVYDVKSTPPVGGTAKFETYTAEYVGAGG